MRAAPWTLAAKLVVIGFSLLLVALGAIGLTLWMTWHLEGGAAAVNEAGRMRMQAYRLELEAGRGPRDEVARRVALFDASIDALSVGEPGRPLFVPWNDATRGRFAEVRADWDALRAAWLADPVQVPLDRVDEFVAAIDAFVASIEQQMSRSTAILNAVQFAMLALAIGGAVALLYAGYIFVVDPVAQLQRGLARVERGELDTRVAVDSKDEFGQLADAFNRMTANLQALYQGLEDKVREKTAGLEQKRRRLAALYDASALIGAAGSLDELAQGFVRKVREIAHADAAALRWSDEANQRYLMLAGDSLPEAMAQKEQCVIAGTCLCGRLQPQAGVRVVAIRPDPQMSFDHCAAAGYRTLVSVPVVLQQRVLGEIDLFYFGEATLADEDRTLLEALASHLATAMEGLRAAALDVEAAVAQERGLLAQELHDSIAQSLAFLKIQVRLLRDAVARGDARAVESTIGELDAGIRESYSDVRELLVHFRTRTRDEDIEPALRTTLSKFEHQTGLRTHLSVEGHGLPLDPAVQVQVLHVVQEALSNVRKHALATQVWLRVQQVPVWRFEVRDDGRGYDTTGGATDETHVGLRIMRERAQRIGAQVLVESAPGAGTRMVLTLPPQARATAATDEVAA
ncbi:MAG: type IV pili methyl-accepting chemotaxis transducer N-terminal domain-containing protein [Burkholderiaceae bacterium]